MTASSQTRSVSAWDRSRILVATLVLAVGQGVLFLSLARWPSLPTPRRGEIFTVRLADRAPDTQGADSWSEDPRQFSSNHRDPVTSRNPTIQKTPEYPLFRSESAPRWLNVSPEVLWHPGMTDAPGQKPPAGTEVAGPIPGSMNRPQLLKGETSIALRGDLASWKVETSAPAPSSQVDDILPATVIELVVGPGGEVIRARLSVGSGNADADRSALAWARTLRFATTETPRDPRTKDAETGTTGDLVVHWNTRPTPSR